MMMMMMNWWWWIDDDGVKQLMYTSLMVSGNNPPANVLLSQMTQVSRWGQGSMNDRSSWPYGKTSNWWCQATYNIGKCFSCLVVISAFRHPVWSVETLCAYYFTQKKNLRFCGCKKNQREKTHTQEKKTSPMRRAAAQQLGCNSLVLLYFSPGNENPSSPKGDNWHHSTPRVAHAEPPKHQCVLS